MTYFRQLIERFLGVPPVEAGQGTAWRFRHSFPWSQLVLLLFVAFAVAYVISVYRRDAGSLSRGRRAVLVGLRLAAIGMVLFFLSEATLTIERTGLPYIFVLLDVSGSMATPDQYQDARQQKAAETLVANEKLGSPTRLNIATAILTRKHGEFLRKLQERHKLRIYTFAEGTAWLGNRDLLRPEEFEELLPLLRELKPGGDQTRPGAALRTVLTEMRGTPPAAIIVLSDGITTTTDAERLTAAAEFARSRAVPIYTIGLGNEEPLRDVILFDTLVDEVAFVDDPIKFSARLKGAGYEGQKVDIVLKQVGQAAVLARKTVQIPADGEPSKIELTYTPREVGEFDFLLEATALPKEFRVDNNREIRHVSVSKEKIRVLLADSIPRYEFRYLKHLLQRESKTIDFSVVLQDADPEYADEDEWAIPRFPVTREELFRFDVILFGDMDLTDLTLAVQENIREFVREKGGGLLMIAGPQHNPLSYGGTPLEALLPIELEGARAAGGNAVLTESFQPELTPEGSKGTSIFRLEEDEPTSIAAWNNLPGIFWFVEAQQLKPGAVPFAVHPLRTGSSGKFPIIAMQRYGAGKVVLHTTDDTWRWRFRVGDRYFGRYWVQSIRYLSRSRLMGKDRTAELTVDRTVYQRGEPVYLRVRFLNEQLAPQEADGVTVVVERQGDVQRRIKLQRVPQAPAVFEGQLSQTAEGTYHAWVTTPAFKEAPPSKDFRVESPLRETQTLRMDLAELTRSAERTQGKYYPFSEATQLLDDLPPGRPVPLKTDDPKRLWNHWLSLLTCIILLGTEWWLRKRAQLT